MIANQIDRLCDERQFVAWIRAGLAVAAFRVFLIKSNWLGGRSRPLPSGAVAGTGVLVIHDAGPVMLLAGIVVVMHLAIGLERARRGG
ncbi:MAG TPA: hypothetical protein VHY35_11990 [Stellaceae bacterium]|nr:hypothetical protein [Stellaceae bacterium]